jgi:hypothetical protein
MIVGVMVGAKVHPSQIARAACYGTVQVYAPERQLSRHP